MRKLLQSQRCALCASRRGQPIRTEILQSGFPFSVNFCTEACSTFSNNHFSLYLATFQPGATIPISKTQSRCLKGRYNQPNNFGQPPQFLDQTSSDSSSPAPTAYQSEKQHLQFIERGDRSMRQKKQHNKSIMSSVNTLQMRPAHYRMNHSDSYSYTSESHASCDTSMCSTISSLEEDIEDPSVEVDLALFSPLLASDSSSGSVAQSSQTTPTSVRYQQQTYKNTRQHSTMGRDVRCSYCFIYYQNTCRKRGLNPENIPKEGPWNWHQSSDKYGVKCPLMWFHNKESTRKSNIWRQNM
ncbi:unnamed protein product [Caenorhabditis auriculariae]|uniref:Uncharacterized protein n=1 Tax=Caenorhabditis auriculariae TaxID=2777116 RepID=A0A8S1H0G9_9PELO|nr:unnamed protein product [Caenorhabditis auriculariae]